MHACKFAPLESVRLLLEHGALPNNVDWDGKNAFRYAVVSEMDVLDKLKLLIRKGGKIDNTYLLDTAIIQEFWKKDSGETPIAQFIVENDAGYTRKRDGNRHPVISYTILNDKNYSALNKEEKKRAIIRLVDFFKKNEFRDGQDTFKSDYLEDLRKALKNLS